MKKDIIRVGDTVHINNPEMFVRCGYPETTEDEIPKVTEEFSREIDDFLNNVEIEIDGIYAAQHNRGRLREKIIREVAYTRLKQRGFGGGERAIHTLYNGSYENSIKTVYGIRFVKTGNYYAPQIKNDYFYGVSEYEPGGRPTKF